MCSIFPERKKIGWQVARGKVVGTIKAPMRQFRLRNGKISTMMFGRKTHIDVLVLGGTRNLFHLSCFWLDNGNDNVLLIVMALDTDAGDLPSPLLTSLSHEWNNGFVTWGTLEP